MDPRDAPRPCMQSRPGCARREQERVHTTNPLHSHPCTPGTGEQQQSLGRAYKVTLGGTNARVQRCQTRHHPIAAMQAGPPGPTFAGQTRTSSNRVERLPIDTGKEPFARTGGTSEPSHRKSCAYAAFSSVAVHVCCYLCLPAFVHLLCLCCPSRLFIPIELAISRLQAVFSETLAAFRHSLAMTSSPIPPAGHYPIEPLLASSARSRYAHWRSSRQPQSAWQAPVPWAANRLRTRDSRLATPQSLCVAGRASARV